MTWVLALAVIVAVGLLCAFLTGIWMELWGIRQVLLHDHLQRAHGGSVAKHSTQRFSA